MFGCGKSSSLSCCVGILDREDEKGEKDKEGIAKQMSDWTGIEDMLSNEEMDRWMIS